MANGNPTPPEQPKAASPTVWSAVVALVIMGALVAILAITANAYPTASDAASILGVVVPALVSLGAAAFGVAVAYNAVSGKSTAEAGKVEAQAKQLSAEGEKQQAVTVAQSTATDAMSELKALETALQRIVQPLKEASTSPVGEADLLLQPPGQAAPVKVRDDDIANAKASIAAAQNNMETLLRTIPD
jgi:parvulin-like peptidyl-prolyl isomerase